MSMTGVGCLNHNLQHDTSQYLRESPIATLTENWESEQISGWVCTLVTTGHSSRSYVCHRHRSWQDGIIRLGERTLWIHHVIFQMLLYGIYVIRLMLDFVVVVVAAAVVRRVWMIEYCRRLYFHRLRFHHRHHRHELRSWRPWRGWTGPMQRIRRFDLPL